MAFTDEKLRNAVAAELDWDPRVDSTAVIVSARNGVITLRGTVGSFSQKCDAKLDARRVYGVVRVDDALEVALADDDHFDDIELRDTVVEALRLNSLVPISIDARVDTGWATLMGTARWQFQRAEAEQVATRVRGVFGVTNAVEIVPAEPGGDDLGEAIGRALRRNARLDVSSISAVGSHGIVTLSGSVGSWADHDEAVSAAWAAPGVHDVVDDIRITY
jgi:osmotically-inducible protein OsmY